MDTARKINWPGWEVVRVIGRGGFGEVYEIQRDIFGNIEKAALKVITIPQSRHDIDELLNDGYDSESITLRFRSYLESIVNEYSLMQELKGNTNIVYCDDLRYIQHDDGIGWDIYIKMELLTPLLKALPAQAPEEQVIQLGMDICNALILCKNRGILHRDIKPQNIFVSKDGDYKLGDFGIAKITERTTSGTKVGTYKYMAPEVYHNQPYGSAADLYSLGLVMYWLLNEHRTPFLPLPPRVPTVSVEDEARNRRLSGETLPPPAHGSYALQQIVLKACAPDPKDRYHSANEMREDLEALLQKTEGLFQPRTEKRDMEDRTLQLERGEARTQIEDATQGLFQNRKNNFRCQGWTERTGSQSDNPEDLTQLDEEAYLQQRDKQPQEEFQRLQEQLQEEKSRNNRNKKVIAVIACAVLVIAGIILCLQLFPAKETDGDEEMQAPPAATDAAETAAPTQDSAERMYQEVRAHCASLAASGDISGAIRYAQEMADRNDDPRYPALVAEYQGMLKDAVLDEAEALAAEGQYRKAIRILDEAWKENGEQKYFDLAGDYRMAFGKSNTAYVAAGKFNSILILDDGRVVVSGDEEYGELDSKYWSDIVAVSAGDLHTVGLRSNGTVVAVGDNEQGQCATGSWSNVVAISAGDVHTVALLENGTLVAAGQQWAPRCDMAGLYNRAGGKRIVSIAAGYVHTLALLEDGTVIAVGENGNKQCDVEGWRDIAAIYAGTYYSLGLKTDGSVVVAGYTDWNIAGWTDMVNLAAGDYFVVGLTSENTILSAGMQRDIGPNTPNTISFWQDIVQISAGHDHIIALTKDGKSRCAGRDEYGQIYLDGFSVTYPRMDDCVYTKETDSPQKKNHTDEELINLVVGYFQENMDSGYEGNYVAFADELFEDEDRGRLCVVVRFQRTDAYATSANTLVALVSVDQAGDLFVDGEFLGNLFNE